MHLKILLIDEDPESDRVAAVQAQLKCGTNCGSCLPELRAMASTAVSQPALVAEAQAGRIVVRLKGGDPFIFGRGGEECAALRSANIRHEVINGITSGLAAPSSLGIPLTHRDVCHGAIFVTGHSGEGSGDVGPNWRALAATGLPLVIYMGIAQSELIEQELLAGGLAPDTPVAVIQHASRSNQRELVTVLAGLSAIIRESGIGSPGIIVVGETVRFARSVEARAGPIRRSRAAAPSSTSASPSQSSSSRLSAPRS